MVALKRQVADTYYTYQRKWTEEYFYSCLKKASLCTVYNENILLRDTAKERIHHNCLDTGPVKEGQNNSD
jgi:hypothetical protein